VPVNNTNDKLNEVATIAPVLDSIFNGVRPIANSIFLVAGGALTLSINFVVNKHEALVSPDTATLFSEAWEYLFFCIGGTTATLIFSWIYQILLSAGVLMYIEGTPRSPKFYNHIEITLRILLSASFTFSIIYFFRGLWALSLSATYILENL
jgi:hypothetical protein